MPFFTAKRLHNTAEGRVLVNRGSELYNGFAVNGIVAIRFPGVREYATPGCVV
jgi:hypothetical protein